MSYPKFFDAIESIQVSDPLSKALGAFDDGMYAFCYLDVVKSAGHSCPTVAGAYLMTLEALKFLYPHERAVRGNIKVAFEEDAKEGVAGVIANVISQITGATEQSGFKGLQGKFARHSLMEFNMPINASARFTRTDTGKGVDVFYNPSSIVPNPDMQVIMQKMQKGQANADELQKFGVLWQERVQRIFENREKVIRIEEV
jgi:formylmethanofuran dehydrogenase subunit E